MLRGNRSGNVTQLRTRLTPVDLLAFLLAGLLVLAMVSLTRADTWDETISKAKKEGKLVAALGGSAGRDIDRLGRRGLPVANFGRVIGRPVKERPLLQGTGSGNNLMVINRRPHPYATKLFVNWFLSKEGQTIMHTKSERVPDQTFRIDVTKMGKVNEAEIRRPGIDYVTLMHDPETQKKLIWSLKNAEKLYRQIRGK